MKHQPTYLYQVKNSKNFYFRARKKIFLEKIHYISLPQGHFVASLKMRISVNPNGHFGFIRSLFLLLFRPCQFYLK
ncbi:hypothetical protein BM528_08130 [Alteromonas sp. RW2A1]|nr:hypothetical protein BM528_08130 [Alteromonas sp. RW2A1]